MITRDVEAAAAAIRAGGLVGLPTETVYGLAADAADPAAIARLYAVKGRPADHPSIVHVASIEDARTWCSEWPATAESLTRRFWPGPLTIILPAGDRPAREALGGTGTVALRMPDSPLALALIQAAGTGLAAPSANRFGRVSPTTAQHVHDDLGDDVELILDGGPCRVGVESTIVDLTGKQPRVLRPGAITAAMVEEALATPLELAGPDSPRAPGTLLAHYAPTLPVALIERLDEVDAPATTALIAPTGVDATGFLTVIDAGSTAAVYAERLYGLLRDADRSGAERIAALPPPAEGIGLAVIDRLRRAAAGAWALDGAPDADERT